MFGSKAKSTAVVHECTAAQAVCYKFTMMQAACLPLNAEGVASGGHDGPLRRGRQCILHGGAVLLAFFLRDRRSDNKACRSMTNGVVFK